MRAAFFAAIFLLCPVLVASADAASWRIKKDHWSEADEKGFSAFVQAIGETNCSSSQSCLRNPANPFRNTDQSFVDIDVDCAKLPYLLRAYYAWKNGLPFGFVNGVSGEGGDLRYTKTANRATSRHDIVDRGGGINGPNALLELLSTVFSGTYRTDASEKKGVLSDFYSPAIQPGSIHPGTIVYDVNGHVGIVYKVDGDGRAYYMDAHPDFTITRSVYGAQFGQSPARLGGGFKNWRPMKLVGAHRDKFGVLLGGHIAMAENDQIPDYSLIQYSGTQDNPKLDVKKAKWIYNDIELGFYEYVRVAVSGGKMDYNPIYEMNMTMQTLCNDLNDRAQYVDLAIKDGIANKAHPSRLPDNIYGSANEEWEEYSTPSRDARIKTATAQFYKDMAEMIDLWIHRDPRIVYDGVDLRRDLLKAYDQKSQTCTITYLSSGKRPVAMTFDDLIRRMFKISFDPYHCVELRWGGEGDERASCPDGKDKGKWYVAEQRLRNQPDRTYDIQMGFSIDELNKHVKGSGINDPPPIDIRALIENMGDQVPFQGMTAVGR
ncbi:MAG: hypothetical protein HY243_08040 [Proteobacteria bacterium]|nr:hypothetical protein [Pseudomonadota bacterium]